MNKSGKFDTTTKTKIHTEHGTILKVTIYDADERNYITEYRIKPKCDICGGDVGCVCFHEDNSDNPYRDAFEHLIKRWLCDKAHCICTFMKDSSIYKKLEEKYGDDEWSIAEALQEEMQYDGEDIFCAT